MVPREECPIIDLKELTLENILSGITDGKLGFLLVEDHHQFKGIISNAELRKTLLDNLQDIHGMDCQEMINRTPITILDTDNVDKMLNLVREHSFPVTYLPVLNDKGNAVGIVTFVNLIKGEI
jgi:CBS-domain-containing membrane protein